MRCLAPINIPLPGRGLQTVRCGQCRACRIRRKAGWTGRLLLEFQSNLCIGQFVTLTYEDAPEVLDYRDFQLFMKRFRRRFGACRFFVVGEYGENTGRGHWHALIYGQLAYGLGLDKLDCWDHGLAYVGNITAQSAGYCAGYTLKEIEKHGRERIVRGSNRPGLGLPGIRSLARKAARIFSEEPADSWPTSFGYDGRRYPLSQGAFTAFKEEYLKEGGLPPRETDPDVSHLDAIEYTKGDAFFEERYRRDRWAALEAEKLDGSKARRNTSI